MLKILICNIQLIVTNIDALDFTQKFLVIRPMVLA